jgi:hypothetical protein
MACVCSRSLAGIAGSNTLVVHKYLSLSVVCVCCQVEVFLTGRSLVQRSPTECGVSECDRRTSQRMPRLNKGCWATKNKIIKIYCSNHTHVMNTSSILLFDSTAMIPAWETYSCAVKLKNLYILCSLMGRYQTARCHTLEAVTKKLLCRHPEGQWFLYIRTQSRNSFPFHQIVLKRLHHRSSYCNICCLANKYTFLKTCTN